MAKDPNRYSLTLNPKQLCDAQILCALLKKAPVGCVSNMIKAWALKGILSDPELLSILVDGVDLMVAAKKNKGPGWNYQKNGAKKNTVKAYLIVEPALDDEKVEPASTVEQNPASVEVLSPVAPDTVVIPETRHRHQSLTDFSGLE